MARPKRSLDGKLDKIIKTETKILKKLEGIERKENAIEREEEREARDTKGLREIEEGEIDELKKLELLEKEVKDMVVSHPLTKVTYRDVVKGTIGAFIGIVSHFSFLEGVSHSEHLSLFRATLILITAFVIGVLFIYFSGFRKVKTVRILSFIPIRVTLIFFTAISVIIIVFWLFGVFSPETTFIEGYKMVATTSILAMLGAGTADLIGEH